MEHAISNFKYTGPREGLVCYPEVPLSNEDNLRYAWTVFKFWHIFFPGSKVDQTGCVSLDCMERVWQGLIFQNGSHKFNYDKMDTYKFVENDDSISENVSEISWTEQKERTIEFIAIRREKYSADGKLDYYEGRRFVYELCQEVSNPGEKIDFKGGFFRRNGENFVKKDKSDDWTNFIYRKLYFYQDYYQIFNEDETGQITTMKISNWYSKCLRIFGMETRYSFDTNIERYTAGVLRRYDMEEKGFITFEEAREWIYCFADLMLSCSMHIDVEIIEKIEIEDKIEDESESISIEVIIVPEQSDAVQQALSSDDDSTSDESEKTPKVEEIPEDPELIIPTIELPIKSPINSSMKPTEKLPSVTVDSPSPELPEMPIYIDHIKSDRRLIRWIVLKLRSTMLLLMKQIKEIKDLPYLDNLMGVKDLGTFYSMLGHSLFTQLKNYREHWFSSVQFLVRELEKDIEECIIFMFKLLDHTIKSEAVGMESDGAEWYKPSEKTREIIMSWEFISSNLKEYRCPHEAVEVKATLAGQFNYPAEEVYNHDISILSEILGNIIGTLNFVKLSSFKTEKLADFSKAEWKTPLGKLICRELTDFRNLKLGHVNTSVNQIQKYRKKYSDATLKYHDFIMTTDKSMFCDSNYHLSVNDRGQHGLLKTFERVFQSTEMTTFSVTNSFKCYQGHYYSSYATTRDEHDLSNNHYIANTHYVSE